jgi:hypothetical protein
MNKKLWFFDLHGNGEPSSIIVEGERLAFDVTPFFQTPALAADFAGRHYCDQHETFQLLAWPIPQVAAYVAAESCRALMAEEYGGSLLFALDPRPDDEIKLASAKVMLNKLFELAGEDKPSDIVEQLVSAEVTLL